MLLVSTDWVFDGTQGGAAEDEPPNPVDAYGFLKAASELVVAERARRGAVARIAGVQGVHRARPDTPRVQDAGFGYLVASVVGALRAGRPFSVWESPEINGLRGSKVSSLQSRVQAYWANSAPPRIRRAWVGSISKSRNTIPYSSSPDRTGLPDRLERMFK